MATFSGDPVFDNSESRSEMQKAAQRSFQHGDEEGGWFKQGSSPERWHSGTKSGITPSARPGNASGFFHAHPNSSKGWVQQQSGADIKFNNNTAKVNSYVIARQNIYLQMPNQNPTYFGATNNYFNTGSYYINFFGLGF
jgi:hypothetical protein